MMFTSAVVAEKNLSINTTMASAVYPFEETMLATLVPKLLLLILPPSLK